jgi:hypothetical protein
MIIVCGYCKPEKYLMGHLREFRVKNYKDGSTITNNFK